MGVKETEVSCDKMKLIKQDYMIGLAFIFNQLAQGMTRYIILKTHGGINCEANPIMKSALTQSFYIQFILIGIGYALILSSYLSLRKRALAEPSEKHEFALNLLTAIAILITGLDVLNDLPYYVYALYN